MSNNPVNRSDPTGQYFEGAGAYGGSNPNGGNHTTVGGAQQSAPGGTSVAIYVPAVPTAASAPLSQSDPLGPNPGNFFTLGAGVDVVLLGGFEVNGGIFMGRTRSGELQGGLFVEGGPAAGVALSADVQGEFITNVDKLDREFSINVNVGFLAANGIVSVNPTPPNSGDRFIGDFINAGGAGLSLGPIPVEGFISFTGTRTLDVIAPVRRFFGSGEASP